jgi:hypothetical protein
LQEGTLLAELVFHELLFSVFLSFGEGPRRAAISTVEMIGVMREFPMRKSNGEPEIASFLAGDGGKAVSRLADAVMKRFLWSR